MMSLNEIIVEGTVQPDGKLVLDEALNLPEGRVTVVVQPQLGESASADEGWYPYLQRLRARREAERYPFLDAHELESHLSWLRDDEDRIDRVHRQIAEDRRKRAAEQRGFTAIRSS